MQPRPFLILSSQHAGTHFLREALSSPSTWIWNEWHPLDRDKNCATSCQLTRPDWPWTTQLEMMMNCTAAGTRCCGCLYSTGVGSVRGGQSASLADAEPWRKSWKEQICQSTPSSSSGGGLGLRAIGVLWQANHGWMDHRALGGKIPALYEGWTSFLPHFVPWLKARGVRVILLERANVLAWTIAAPNFGTAGEQGESSRPFAGLKEHQVEGLVHAQFRISNGFDDAFGLLQAAGVPTARVAYERITSDYHSLALLLHFVGVPQVSWDAAMSSLSARGWSHPISNSTKHLGHSATPADRIENARELLDSSLAKGYLKRCMVYDTCPVPLIKFSHDVFD